MLQKTEGIVLKTIKYSESSVITKLFTREFGEYSFIVPGVRGSRNKSKGNLFQPLQILEMDLYYHPNKSILKLKEYRPGHIYTCLYTDMIRQSVAIFSLEVLSKCIVEHEVNHTVYDFFRSYLMQLDHLSEVDAFSPQQFLLDLSHHLGFKPTVEVPFDERPYFNLEYGTFEKEPSFSKISLDRKEAFLVYEFLEQNFTHFTKNDRIKLLEILITYFKFHIPTFKDVTSLEIIRQVLK